jgi:hypothetical protein
MTMAKAESAVPHALRHSNAQGSRATADVLLCVRDVRRWSSQSTLPRLIP